MKWWACLLSALLTCAAARADETVIIGAEDDWYPYSGLVDGEVRGITIDLVRAAFQAVGITVKYDVMPYARCMALARVGALVGCFDTLRHPGIEPDYLWHEQPMFMAQYQIYARADSPEHDLHPKDLEGKEVAVTNGYEYGPEFDSDHKILHVVTLRDENNFRVLAAGRVPYTVAMELTTQMLIHKHPADFTGKFKVVGKVAPCGVYTVFSKQNPSAPYMMQRFNEGMAAIRKNGRYQAIFDDWTKRLVEGK